MARLLLGLVAGAAAGKDIQIVYGVMEGILSDQPHLATCVADGIATVDGAKASVVDMKKAVVDDKNLLEVADALDETADTLSLIPQTMIPCGATKHDVDAVSAALKEIDGFQDLLKKMKKHFVFNSKAIIGDVVAARNSLQNKNYEDFGKHVGMALHRLALGKFHDNTLNENDVETQHALEIIYGLSVGMLSDKRHLAICIADGLETSTDAKSALADLKAFVADKNVLELADALHAIATTLRMIPETMSPCGATEDDFSAIRAALKEIDGFQDFVKKAKRHIILNSKGIIADAEAALQAKKLGDYEGFGEHLGVALHKIAFGRFPRQGDVVV